MKHTLTRTAAVALCAVLLTSLAVSGDGMEVVHALGTSRVSAGPKRVVTFDLSVLDSLDALGVEGIAYAVPKQAIPPYLAKYGAGDVVDAGGMKEPNLERIYEFGPDVIFVSARQTDYYEKLSAIAPTVALNADYKDFLGSFSRNMRTIGDIFGMGDAAAAKADAVIAAAARTAEKASAGGKRALIVMVNDGAISAYGPGSRFGLIHDVLKVTPADMGIKVSLHGQSVDFEYISRVDPDILFVINRNTAIGTNNASVSRVLDNELVMGTKAGKNGKIVSLDSAVWYLSGSGLESLAIMVDEVNRALD